MSHRLQVLADADAVAELFGFLEFSSLQDRFSEAFGAFLTAPLADGDARVLEAELVVRASSASEARQVG